MDFLKLQAEAGSNDSYRKASKELEKFSLSGRSSINKDRIRKSTIQVGQILSESNCKESPDENTNACVAQESADAPDELHIALDGGYTHSCEIKGKNFEVMAAKIYDPKNIVAIDKHHNQITKRHCASSAKDDKQKTMQANLLTAAHKEKINKSKTKVTVFADGAKNCWNIASVIAALCLSIVLILDWFHIGKYIKRMKTSMPELKEQFTEINSLLWCGKTDEALNAIKKLQAGSYKEKQEDLLSNFYDYINDNRDKIVDYQARKKQGLPISSHVAESTIEHLLNARAKKKQKMQWSRHGLHSVMQIRCSQTSNEWDADWENVIVPKLKEVA